MYPRTVQVFIASANDTMKQRAAVERAIYALNAKFNRLFNVTLQPVKWEAFRPEAVVLPDRDVQRPITRRLDKCHWFICILNRRYGTPLPTSGLSGTHDEVRFALAHRERITILTYFNVSHREATTEDTDQAPRLNMLKEEIHQAGVRSKSFLPQNFEQMVTLDMLESLLEMTTDLHRKELLERFFRFGLRADQRDPSVLIGYPPIHKHFGPSIQSNYDWSERLVPNVVYDDFKTIQKVEAALQCMGISDYGAVTIDQPRLVQRPGNRIWLCVPRNPLAKDELLKLGVRAWFRFEEDPVTHEQVLIWTPPGRSPICIRSPLAKYLKAFRPHRKTAWDPRFGYMVGRDFAVLARFRSEEPAGGTPLYHYYLAGIRGLGTWGTGWYIENRFEALAQEADRSAEDDIQLLLEVTFKRYRIETVEIVGDRDSEYFEHRYSDAAVALDIAAYKRGYPFAR